MDVVETGKNVGIFLIDTGQDVANVASELILSNYSIISEFAVALFKVGGGQA